MVTRRITYRLYPSKQPEVFVRKACLEDAAAICSLHVISVRQLCASDYAPDHIEAWVGKLTPDVYRQVIEQWGGTMFVAEKEKSIIGCSALSGNEVRAVYVHPLHTRQGIGRLLLDVLEKEAFARRIEKLILTASLNAKLFYQGQGYNIVEYSWYTLPCGTQIPCIFMEKYLVPSIANRNDPRYFTQR